MSRICLAIVAVLGVMAARTVAQTYIVNLSDQPAYFAGYKPVSTNASSGQSRRWEVSGWGKADPGRTFRGNEGYWYVEQNRQPLSWNLDKLNAAVKDGQAFRGPIVLGSEAASMQQLLGQGYRNAVYYRFQNNGIYQLQGSKFMLQTEQITIDDASRQIKVGGKTITPSNGGFVVRAWFVGSLTRATHRISYGPGDRNASISWTLTGGYRRWPTDGRARASITGTFHVQYAWPRN